MTELTLYKVLESFHLNDRDIFRINNKIGEQRTRKRGKLHCVIGINLRTYDYYFVAFNDYLSWETVSEKKNTIHAEQNALKKLNSLKKYTRLPNSKKRGKCVFLSLRISQSGKLGNSLACTSCAKMLSKSKHSPDSFAYLQDGLLLCVPCKELPFCPGVRPSSCQKKRVMYKKIVSNNYNVK